MQPDSNIVAEMNTIIDSLSEETLDDTIFRIAILPSSMIANAKDQDKLSLSRCDDETMGELLERFTEDCQIPIIDWSLRESFEESHCECRCRGRWYSHAKFSNNGVFKGIVTRLPCPRCLSHISVVKVLRI